MAKVRIKLDCIIEVPGDLIPRGLPERIADFVEGGLEAVGAISEDRDAELLPGARMSATLVRTPKREVT